MPTDALDDVADLDALEVPDDRAALRAKLRREREVSRYLGARADAVRTHAAELRRLVVEQNQCWQRWHRVWGRIAGTRPSRSLADARWARPLVRVCMYCTHVYVALPLARGEAEADVAWRPVPSWVRDQLGAAGLRVVPSHGICPACEQRHAIA